MRFGRSICNFAPGLAGAKLRYRRALPSFRPLKKLGLTGVTFAFTAYYVILHVVINGLMQPLFSVCI